MINRFARHAQFARFCTVGAANTAITLAVYAALVAGGMTAWSASALGFIAGAASGFHWNSRWTFAHRNRGPRVAVRYVVAQGMGTLASALGVTLTHDVLGLAHLPAELCILPWVAVLMYLLMRNLVFRDAPEGGAPA